jgi:hypothetical protein
MNQTNYIPETRVSLIYASCLAFRLSAPHTLSIAYSMSALPNYFYGGTEGHHTRLII